MRVERTCLLIIAGLLLAAALTPLSSADENASRDFRLEFYDDYCNCDEDCGGLSSCLSEDTDSFIRGMNTQTDEAIEEAHEAGFKGVCTSVTIDNEFIIYEMTSDCTGYAPEDKAEESDNSSETAQNSTTGNTNVSGGEAEAPPNRIITISFDGGNTTGDELPSEGSAEGIKEITGGFSMELVTAGIVAGTIVLVGFFGLMAWMAYLLQKKSSEKKDRKQ